MNLVTTAPGAPWFLISAACGLLLSVLLSQLERPRRIVAGIRRATTTGEHRRRILVGQMIALPLALVPVLIVVATGASGPPALLLILLALLAELTIGIWLPRRPERLAERERRTLRLLTPSFVAFLQVSLASQTEAKRILEDYVAVKNPPFAPMQAVVREALRAISLEHPLPFGALVAVARQRGCQELRDLCEALAQAEQGLGAGISETLALQKETLITILRSEEKRRRARQQLLLTGVCAISLMVGLLGSLLWGMAGALLFGGA